MDFNELDEPDFIEAQGADVEYLASLLIQIRDELRGLRADMKAGRGGTTREPVRDDGRYEAMCRALELNFNGIDCAFSSEELEAACKSDDELAKAIEACSASDSDSIGYMLRDIKDKRIGPYTVRRYKRVWRLERAECT